MIILFLCAMPLLFLIISVTGCVISLFRCLNQYAWISSESAIITLIIHNDEWRLLTNDGQEIKAQLLGSSFNGSNLILLNFKRTRAKKNSVIIMKDTLDVNSWRKLRAYLTFTRV